VLDLTYRGNGDKVVSNIEPPSGQPKVVGENDRTVKTVMSSIAQCSIAERTVLVRKCGVDVVDRVSAGM
jgi:hypothetical protein